ncbi:MAG TPA: PKD domain-containing protein, partial [Puia sp.]|nr:PKD domain-containing protein [Puia sp.]
METRFLLGLLTLFITCSITASQAQVSNPYIINGNAYQENCNCYTLTDDQTFLSGSVWNKYKIDLTQSFDFTFNVFLGCRDADGADGIAFVLQPIGTSIGTNGGGLGYMGINPSVGILIDTWQNVEFHDLPYDHLVIFKNGNIDNADVADVLDGPIPALPNDGNIEDCQWHLFHITWNATNHLIKAQIDNMQTVQATIDMVNQIFFGSPQVYWGFTGATGGKTNHQRFCTSLNPGFRIPANQNTCFPTPIYFQDSSTSFGSIIKWEWDFGDGTFDSVDQPPAHNFAAPGIYNVKLNIVGNNGCLSDTFKRQIVVGSKPKADFVYPSPMACGTGPFTLTDNSFVQYGTINNWTWNVNNGQEITTTSTGSLTQNFSMTMQNVSLTVSTVEGCISDPVSHSFPVYPAPSTTISTENACFGNPVTFQAGNADPS